MTNEAYDQMIDDLEKRLKQAEKLTVQHRAEIKALKVRIEDLNGERNHLASELELERSRNQDADCMADAKDQRLEREML